MSSSVSPMENWSSLSGVEREFSKEIIGTMKKLEIKNILKSYTGFYDIFCEMIRMFLTRLNKESLKRRRVTSPRVFAGTHLRDDGEHVRVEIRNSNMYAYFTRTIPERKQSNIINGCALIK